MSNYCKKLTREMLEEMGIYEIYWDEENNEWWVDRYWYPAGTKHKDKKVHIRLKQVELRRKHKYVPDTVYPGICFSYQGRTYTYTLSRLLYAWFNGVVDDGEQVDHITNNKYDNRLDNLDSKSIADNIRKRFEDNHKNCFNQWKYVKGE